MAEPLELPLPPSPSRRPQSLPSPPQPVPCPDCGAGLTRQSGCLVCVQCGWARCG